MLWLCLEWVIILSKLLITYVFFIYLSLSIFKIITIYNYQGCIIQQKFTRAKNFKCGKLGHISRENARHM